ncbi:FkbM family methyltransferase [Methylophilaceae bacterium]|nr:FkbM family methyltransferase [Methylophilaceae bacterium]
MKNSNQAFGYYSPKGVSKIIYLLAKAGLGFGSIKKIYARILTKVNRDNPLDIIYHNLKFRLYPHNNTIESKMIVSSKLREGKELDVISGFIGHGGTFLDIGANVGYYSLMAASLGADKILAIEPNPIVLNRLKANIKFNKYEKKIKVFEIGVGEKKDILELRVSHKDMGGSTILNNNLNSDKIKIDIMPLEDLLRKEGIDKVNVLKIDIEGFEDRALFPYFEKLEKKFYPELILMEDSSQKEWQRNILEWLLANGYNILSRTRGNVLIAINK